MFRDQTFGTKTSELIDGTSHKDIDPQSLRQYREYMSSFNPDVSYNLLDTDNFLSKLRISDPESAQLTYAGLLFLGKRTSIEKYFPDFRIDLLEIPGTSYSDASSRYTFRLHEDKYENIWQAYFECYNRLRKEVKVAYQVSDEGFGEELSPGLKSFREALVNMLMHADYFSPAHPRIRIFENRIEFYNPGGLPKPLEELKQKDLSIPRNPILAKLFRMVRIAENAGYGFDKMETNWKAYNQTSPEYEMEFDSVIVKFNLASKSKDTSELSPDSLEDVMKVIRDGILYINKTPEFIQSTLRDIYGVFTG